MGTPKGVQTGRNDLLKGTHIGLKVSQNLSLEPAFQKRHRKREPKGKRLTEVVLS